MRILASFYEISGNFKKKDEYYLRYQKVKLELSTLHWNETDGIWYDYDLERKAHSNTYYVCQMSTLLIICTFLSLKVSNALPLFAKCYDDEIIPHRVYNYLLREGVLNFTKGIPTSLAMSSMQQWDKEVQSEFLSNFYFLSKIMFSVIINKPIFEECLATDGSYGYRGI
jgi:alpha,alpha-trehalase